MVMRLLARALTLGLLACLIATGVRTQKPAPDQSPDGSPDRARQDDNTLQSQTEDDAKPFTPPAASKSVEVGNYYFIKKQYQGALSRYREATRTDPYYAPAYLGMGKTYDKLGQQQKALDAYQKYLDLLPSEKQADEAKKVHVAMARLERALKKSGQLGKTAPGSQAGNRNESPDARSQ